MDIDLLAKMVKEAILDHDTVTLPGVGCFVAELVPSTFSDKGYTINPPYRRLFFSPKQGGDTYLADLYARDNEEVNGEMATRILTEFLTEMKEVLKVRKTVVFPGLGRLRATRENHFFFVADEDLDIYPEGLGLAPLSLKTHVETPEEVATAVAGLAELISEPEPEPAEEIPGQVGNDEEVAVGDSEKEPETIVVPEPVKEPEPIVVPQPAKEPESIPEPAPVPEPEPIVVPEPVKEPEPIVEPEPVKEPEPLIEPAPDKKKSRKWLKVLLIVLAVIGVLLVLLAIIGRVAPGLLDPLLYSKEELQILRY
jgi:nucleoid DNA-binding protein